MQKLEPLDGKNRLPGTGERVTGPLEATLRDEVARLEEHEKAARSGAERNEVEGRAGDLRAAIRAVHGR